MRRRPARTRGNNPCLPLRRGVWKIQSRPRSQAQKKTPRFFETAVRETNFSDNAPDGTVLSWSGGWAARCYSAPTKLRVLFNKLYTAAAALMIHEIHGFLLVPKTTLERRRRAYSFGRHGLPR